MCQVAVSVGGALCRVRRDARGSPVRVLRVGRYQASCLGQLGRSRESHKRQQMCRDLRLYLREFALPSAFRGTPDLYICAVHQAGHTWMVGYTIATHDATPVRHSGRYHLHKEKPIDPSSIGATWDSAGNIDNGNSAQYAVQKFTIIRAVKRPFRSFPPILTLPRSFPSCAHTPSSPPPCRCTTIAFATCAPPETQIFRPISTALASRWVATTIPPAPCHRGRQ